MFGSIVILVLLVLGCDAYILKRSDVRPLHYIVHLKPNTSLPNYYEYLNDEQSILLSNKSATSETFSVVSEFSIGSFKAFVAKTNSKKLLDRLSNHREVVSVEPDGELTFEWPLPTHVSDITPRAVRSLEKRSVQTTKKNRALASILGIQNPVPSWGLRRISERAWNLSAPYTYDIHAGKGVTVYVIDDGIYFNHADFGGRASLGFTAFGSYGVMSPKGSGHGTHVSGIIGGSKYGVAKSVSIVGVQVLNPSGKGSISGIIAGLQYIVQHAKKGAAVINMSLGVSHKTPGANALKKAILAVIKSGLPIIAAAGNAGDSACNYVPGGIRNVFTVSATTEHDQFLAGSSFGKCVSLLAPGNNIVSDWVTTASSFAVMSGTSMAAPHVAGVAALFLASSTPPSSVSNLFAALRSHATQNVITKIPQGVNLLVYNKLQ